MDKNAQQIGFWGVKGSGKTSEMVEHMRGQNRIIYFDAMGNMRVPESTRLKTIRGTLEHIKNHWQRGYKIILEPGNRTSDCMAFMESLLPVLFSVQKPYYNSKKAITGFEITLVIDEAQKFFPRGKLSGEYYGLCEDLFTLGRHYGLNIYGASQRLAQVDTAFRGNCTQQFFFAQGDHTDIEAVRNSTGLKADDVRAIKKFEFLHKSNEFGALIKRGKTKKF